MKLLKNRQMAANKMRALAKRIADNPPHGCTLWQRYGAFIFNEAYFPNMAIFDYPGHSLYYCAASPDERLTFTIPRDDRL